MRIRKFIYSGAQRCLWLLVVLFFLVALSCGRRVGSSASIETPFDEATNEGNVTTCDTSSSCAASCESRPSNEDSTDTQEPCVALRAFAENSVLPVDIIWVIDSSPSMGNEIEIIEANLNHFASTIYASGLDYQVIVIGSESDHYNETTQKQYLEICVPPPLSSVNDCPDADSGTYLHVREDVHSHDGLALLMETYEQYKSRLRTDSITHVILVSDDDAGWGNQVEQYEEFIRDATNPGFPGGVIFHSIVDLLGYIPGCVFDDNCSCGERRGEAYIELSQASGGMVHSVCDENWGPIFDALRERVVEGTLLPCEYTIPQPESGLTVNPEETNVILSRANSSERETLVNVASAEYCFDQRGWYFDNPGQPSRISLCPRACGAWNGTVEFEFGCDTRKQ